MWCHLCLILFFQTINSEEIATIKNETVEDRNKTEPNSFQLQRIVQPSAQTQQFERSLSSNTSSPDKWSKSEFRPSPQLEPYYEFNKFPVVPAIPEAKHFSAFNLGESPIQWPDSVLTTEQSWITRVQFPTTTTVTVPTAKERPYPFYNGDKSSTGKSYSVPEKSDTFYNNLPTIDDWNKFMNYQNKKQLVQKNQFDFTAPVEKPSYDTTSGVGQKTSFGTIEKPPTQGLMGLQQGNPWKKIAKFLVAAIPIGLLISALTPTVITVQSVNGTQSRSRAVDVKGNNKLISSLNYLNSIGCEDRILCELVLSASLTQNGEQHVENLLNTFTQEGKAVEKAEEMRKIFEAIKNQDCRSIVCKDIKDKT